MNRAEMGVFASECGADDGEGFAASAEKLRELVAEANREFNLTRIIEPREFALKHVADSLLIARAFPKLTGRKINILDIGCGGGFPSLALALAFPQWRITAMDSSGKKVNFVAAAAERLGLGNLQTVHARSNEWKSPAKFDVITARAVAASVVIFRGAEHLLKPGGGFIFYKTPGQAAEELPELNADRRAAKYLQWRVSAEFELPGGAGTRCFIYSRRRG